ncbi:MAG: aspartate aminotransferase family protein, partial [Candidatus Acidiferrales bacterium]
MKKLDPKFRKALDAAYAHVISHLENLDNASVAATADYPTLRKRFAGPLVEEGVPPEQVVEELAHGVEGGLLGTSGGRFFGWVIGGSVPAALAADLMTSGWEQNAALYACSPAAAVVKEVAGGWLKEILGLPAGASFALVTGCQMAHVTCLAAARTAVLAKRGWEVERKGLAGAPAIQIYSSDQRHATFERAIRLL